MKNKKAKKMEAKFRFVGGRKAVLLCHGEDERDGEAVCCVALLRSVRQKLFIALRCCVRR